MKPNELGKVTLIFHNVRADKSGVNIVFLHSTNQVSITTGQGEQTFQSWEEFAGSPIGLTLIEFGKISRSKPQ